jgi:hypothetical protein
MTRVAPVTAALAALLALTACSAGAASPSSLGGASLTSTVLPGPSSSPPSASPSSTPTQAPPVAGSESPAAKVTIDPCKLLSDARASAVNGVAYPAGVAHSMSNGGAECVWQNATAHASVVVQVANWPSVSEAQVAYTEGLAAAKGFALSHVSGIGDKAVIARAPGNFTGGIYVRDGTTFFDVVFLAGTPPTDGRLKTTALLVLGALP